MCCFCTRIADGDFVCILRPHLNSSEINILEAIEHFLVGNAFGTDAEIENPPLSQLPA